MNRKACFILFGSGFLLLLIEILLVTPIYAQTDTSAIDVNRCGGVGPAPLDPTYCGCTWGEVYYRGIPVNYMPISLQFGTAFTETSTKIYVPSPITYPYYQTSGHSLTARLGDVMTVSTRFLGETITRTFRAYPDKDNKEQHVPLVVPEKGVWNSQFIGDFSQVSLISGTTLWLGGNNGLLAMDMSTQLSQTNYLPWQNQAVVALAKTKDGTLWIAGNHNLAYLTDKGWQDVSAPFSATIRSLAIHPLTEEIWLGGGETNGLVAVKRNDWLTTTIANRYITALTIDDSGNVWAGTWGAGIFKHDSAFAIDQGWSRFRLKDGLASDYVHAMVSNSADLWIGTYPYFGTSGSLGGISRYHFTTSEWQNYDFQNGLPLDSSLRDATASIFALAVDSTGTLWAGSKDGLYMLATESTWVKDVVADSNVRSISVANDRIWAIASSGELLRLDPHIMPGSRPIVSLPANVYTVSTTVPYSLTAQAQDIDEDGGTIIGWEWTSDRDGYVCTTAEICDLSTLSLGQHEITVRVQDDEGVWSTPVTAHILMNDTSQFSSDNKVYLPVIQSE